VTPGSVRSVRIRLLPWRPRWRAGDIDRYPDGWDVGGFDLGDDPISAVLGFIGLVLFLPVLLFLVVGLVLLSAELAVLLALVPLLLLVQLFGLQPWYLRVASTSGEVSWICAGRTREMLAARRYYRSLRAG
jgi:hypothetical protein